jgi:hypothetical protein
MAGSKEQPKSWGELLNTHRDSWGSRTFATATPAHTAQVRSGAAHHADSGLHTDVHMPSQAGAL